MNKFTQVVAMCAVAAVATPAKGWCPFDSSISMAPFATTYLFQIEDDFTGWNLFFGGTLSAVQTDPNYYKPILEYWLDSALQQWSRVGRVPVKLGFAGWASNGAVSADDAGFLRQPNGFGAIRSSRWEPIPK
jgi:hypothetical protein